MPRNYIILEKVIAIILSSWGIISLYFLVNRLKFFFDIGIVQRISLFNLFVTYHLIILLPLMFILGGFLLLFSKKVGWLITLIALLLNILFNFIPAGKGKSLFIGNLTLIIFSSVITILFILIIYFLMLPPFRIKYTPSKKTWWVIGSITFLILLDKGIMYILS